MSTPSRGTSDAVRMQKPQSASLSISPRSMPPAYVAGTTASGCCAVYQDVRHLAPFRVSEMCMWSRWRSVGEQLRRVRQPELR